MRRDVALVFHNGPALVGRPIIWRETMKCLTTGVLSLLVAFGVLAVAAWSQPPGGPPSMQRGRGGPRQGASQGQQANYQVSVNLLIMALNTNGDDEISASEIRSAASSLKRLDRNRDGKLTADEVMAGGPPAFGGPGQGGFAGQAQGRGGQGGGFGGPGQGARGGPDEPGSDLVEQLMELDTDKDDEVSEEELLEGTERLFEKGDLDEDGAIDEEEAKRLVQQFGPPRGGPGGRDGAGGRGDRPQRPQ